MNIYEKINTILGTEFDRYMRIHPEFADRIPENAHLILLLEGDEGFNKWSHQLGLLVKRCHPLTAFVNREKESPSLFVSFFSINRAIYTFIGIFLFNPHPWFLWFEDSSL